MIYWDQLGCGINNHPLDESFSINHFVEMTIELICKIRRDYGIETINLFAVSWGSILAAEVATQRPDLINRVLVYGQVFKEPFFNEEVYHALENSKLPLRHRETLYSIRESNQRGIDELPLLAKWIAKYTEGYWSERGGKPPIGKVMLGILTSPDYSFKDFKAIILNGAMKNRSLRTELLNIDLSNVLRDVTVPYHILQGETDIVTSTGAITQFVKTSNNENLDYQVVENSGHYPSLAGMDMVINRGFGFLK